MGTIADVQRCYEFRLEFGPVNAFYAVKCRSESTLKAVASQKQGGVTGRLHVATLMQPMGGEALHHRPKNSKRAPGHTVFPYLLRTFRWGGDSSIPPPSSTGQPQAPGLVARDAATSGGGITKAETH